MFLCSNVYSNLISGFSETATGESYRAKRTRIGVQTLPILILQELTPISYALNMIFV